MFLCKQSLSCLTPNRFNPLEEEGNPQGGGGGVGGRGVRYESDGDACRLA